MVNRNLTPPPDAEPSSASDESPDNGHPQNSEDTNELEESAPTPLDQFCKTLETVFPGVLPALPLGLETVPKELLQRVSDPDMALPNFLAVTLAGHISTCKICRQQAGTCTKLPHQLRKYKNY